MTEKYINKQIVYIDSDQKQPNETHDDFSIVVNLDKEVDTVCMLRGVIKKSYYLIQAGFNTFTLKEGASLVTITVPEGNYSATSFKYVVQNLLNANSPNGFIYSISLPNQLTQPSTGKFTYTVANNGGVQPTFIFTSYLWEQFGFERNSTNNFVANSIVSTNVVNFQLKDTLRVHSNIITDLQTNILQEINGSLGGDFSSILYTCPDIEAHSKPFNIKINKFRFHILDEDSNPIKLNLNVLFTLLFYKKNTIMDLEAKTNIDFIKYSILRNNNNNSNNNKNENKK